MYYPSVIGSICACTFALLSSTSFTAQAVAISGQGTWESTLQGRDLDGNAATIEAYYDTTLDITWLADANFAQTSGFDNDGKMNWVKANSWATSLSLGGFNDWRLPTNTPLNGSTFDNTRSTDATTDRGTATTTTDGTDGGWRDSSGNSVSEMGHMHYVTLGNIGSCDSTLPWCTSQSGSGLSNTADFLNIQIRGYWSGSELNSSRAWIFHTDFVGQFDNDKSNNIFAWAVRSGDVGAVPVPAAAWLFGSGLLGIIGVARRKNA